MSGTCPECGTPNPKHHWGTTYFCENKDCGAMLLMKAKPRNIYIALLFANAPDLHLTVRYYAKASEAEEKELIRQVEAYCQRFKPTLTALDFNEEAMFGPRRNIRVLKCTTPLPEWAIGLRLLVPGPDKYEFNPHVTCDLKPCTLAVVAVAVMHKSEVLFRWECP